MRSVGMVLFFTLLSLVLPLQPVARQSIAGATDAADQGRFLFDGKPIMIVPPTSPTRHQLISGIGLPVPELQQSILIGWVLKAQYYLPTSTELLQPSYLENWNDSRRAMPDRTRRGTVERYEVDNMSIRVEPLPAEENPRKTYGEREEDDDDDDDDEYMEDYVSGVKNMWPQSDSTSQPRVDNHRTAEGHPSPPSPPTLSSSDGYPPASSRWNVYKAIELLSERYGFGGHVCVLRTICEAAEAPFTHTGGVFAELLHIMFSPSTTNEPVSQHRDNEYYRAEQLGRAGAPCANIFRECATSLLGMFSGVHDLHSGAYDFFPQPSAKPTDFRPSMR